MIHRSFVLMALGFATFASADDTTERSDWKTLYNEGVALYRRGELELAADRFISASRADETEVAAKSRYNLGNCHYALSLNQMAEGEDVDAIKPNILAAIDAYRGALRLDREDDDARANLELALRALEQFNRESEQDDPSKQSGTGERTVR